MVAIMESLQAAGVRVWYDPAERDDARLLAHACERTAAVVEDTWGLRPPDQCDVYVMTAWRRFVLLSAPLPWRLLLAVSLPFWGPGVAKTWRHAGGWAQRYGDRYVIGVKPARLLRHVNPPGAERLFTTDPNVEHGVERVLCHELAHASLATRALPTWLREGIPLVAEDRYFGRPTLRPDTLDLLEMSRGRRQRPAAAVLVAHTQAYWMTRYLEDEHPGLIKQLLAAPQPEPRGLLASLVATLGLDAAGPEADLRRRAAARFREPSPGPGD